MNNGILSSGYAPPAMPGGLLGSPTAIELIDPYGYDADALRYIRAVEAADGQRLELTVRNAINQFVLDCKVTGIWALIKASCILIGARTLAGSLVPLVGPTPINNNFVSGDYNRKTGLKGNGTNKTIDTRLNHITLARNNIHMACYASEHPSTGAVRSYMGAGGFSSGATGFARNSNALSHRIQTSSAISTVADASYAISYTSGVAPFIGGTRFAPANWIMRTDGRNTVTGGDSQAPFSGNVFVFDRIAAGGGSNAYGDGRIAFYSVGESIALSVLEVAVINLYTAIGNAIP